MRGFQMIQRPNRMRVRVKNEERKQVLEQAQALGGTISDFVRSRVLEKQIVSKADLQIFAEQTRILNELRRLGGLIKHFHLETQGAYSQDTANAIRALETYAREQECNLIEKGKQNSGNNSADEDAKHTGKLGGDG
jgi:hypothetical protein